jgi:hypothetical protein
MATWILVIVTLGLLIATAFYAYHTKRMADASEKDLELKEKPILSFEVGGWMISSDGIKVHFKFCNAGELPIELKRVIFTWWFKSQSETRHRIEKIFKKVLQKQESFEPDPRIRFGEYEFRQHEIDETKSLHGEHFYKRISGIFRVEYSGADGTLRHEEQPIESL